MTKKNTPTDPKQDSPLEDDLTTEFEKQIEQLTKKLTEAEEITKRAQSDYIRLKIDMDGLQARSGQQQAQAKSESIQKVSKALLPFVSQLKQSLEATPPALADNPWVGGITLMYTKVLQSLENIGIQVIHPEAGAPVDFNHHAPISSLPSEELTSGTVHSVIQQGYVYTEGEQTIVLMPAQIVAVA